MIFFEARPVYFHRKGEGSLLLSEFEFECSRTILIKQQQQHIFLNKKIAKNYPRHGTLDPRHGTLDPRPSAKR